MLKGFVIGFFCFIVFLIIHVIVFHTRRIQFRFVALMKIFLNLLPLYILLYVLIPQEAMIIMPADPRVAPGVVIGLSKVFNFMLGVLIYLLLFFGYCQFYFIIDRSISVRVMIEIEKSKDKKLNLEEIKELYDPNYIFTRRFEHMIDSKYIVEDSGYYKNLRKGHVLAKLFGFLKDYLQLGEGG